MADSENRLWQRSRRCDTGHCVEIAVNADGVSVRDSKDPDGPVLSWTRDEWVLFLDGLVKSGAARPDAGLG